MRALLDANVFISYLLYPRQPGPIRGIINAAVLGRFTLLLPEALLTEFAAKVSQKASLSARITAEELHEFVSLLLDVSEEIPAIETKIPAVTQVGRRLPRRPSPRSPHPRRPPAPARI